MVTKLANTFSERRSLYPAVHRLERRGWAFSKWKTAPGRNRELKYDRLTEKRGRRLVIEASQWKRMAEAVARVTWPAGGET
jgi:PadR family transcriptional regulator, regulatory protein PadR